MSERVPVAKRLPEFPWDRLADGKRTALAHPDGIVDLSIGTPVDPVAPAVRDALASAADAHGYPAVHGSAEVRASAVDWLARRHGVHAEPADVLPLIGSKEFIAGLPALLGLGAGDAVAYPALSYPTYAVGIRLAGAEPVAADGLLQAGPSPVRLVWVNSPANPTGQVLPPEHLAKVVAWARERGAIVASDECYLELGWEGPDPRSILHPEVCGGSHEGLLAVHSLSKRSNLAGYRAGFATGDPALVAELLAVRKHAGMMMPAPVQAAMRAALADDAHAEAQKQRYAARRTRLRDALHGAGWAIDHSEAGLYLWARHPELSGWDACAELAGKGILVAPGDFYGPAGTGHVRFALTATDEGVAAAAKRL